MKELTFLDSFLSVENTTTTFAMAVFLIGMYLTLNLRSWTIAIVCIVVSTASILLGQTYVDSLAW